MKLIKIILVLFLLSISFKSYGSYSEIEPSTKLLYTKFYSTISIKYKSDNGLSYLHLLDKNLELINNSGKINKNNQKIISDLKKLNTEKIFLLELEKKEKINKIKIQTNNILKYFKKNFYNPDALIKENGTWYTYIFTNKYYFDNLSTVDYDTLIYNGINSENTVIFYEDDKLYFVKEYKKVKLINDDIIYGFPNKYELLKTIRINKLFDDSSKDDDEYFLNLELISKSLVSGIYKDDDKIKKIYDYILKNIKYSENFTLEDYEVFSGIETFKNKDGVCEGYVEILNLMLGFNNIASSILTGDVIDAPDFPKIGHAWVKIGNYYYDVTFDDPVGASETKKFEEYSYYKLPNDLFYTNRFDKGLTPETLKTTTLEYRKALIKFNISMLVDKYINYNYNLLKIFKFKNKYNISITKDITSKDLINIYGYKTMNGYEIIINGEKKNVKNLNYIILADDTIEYLLMQNNYDLSSFTIIKWITDTGKESYIISNNITYYN